MPSRSDRLMFTGPTPLTSEHGLESFSCGKAPLDDWLRQRALKSDGRSSRTYVVCERDQVVAYYCLATGGTSHAALPGSLRRNAPDPVPMMVLGRLAVDVGFQGQGLGSSLLRDAMLRVAAAHKLIGFRALAVHAKDDDAVTFYLRYGFKEYPSGTRTMFLPIETIVDARPTVPAGDPNENL